MRKKAEAQAMREIQRLNEKELQIALAMLRNMNAGKPDLPVLKLVVGGRDGSNFGSAFRCG